VITLELRALPFDVQEKIDDLADREPAALPSREVRRARQRPAARRGGAAQASGPARIECVMATLEVVRGELPELQGRAREPVLRAAAGRGRDHRSPARRAEGRLPDDGRRQDKGSDGKQRHGDRAIASVLAWAATRAEGRAAGGRVDRAAARARAAARRCASGAARRWDSGEADEKERRGRFWRDAASAPRPTAARTCRGGRRGTIDPTRRTGGRSPATRSATCRPHHAGAHAAHRALALGAEPARELDRRDQGRVPARRGRAARGADEENQKALDRFWKDPINEMAIKLPKKARELAMFGEQLWPVFVNEEDGMVRLGYIDPKIIDIVVTDPDNREQPIGIVTKKDDKGRFYKFRVIINGPRACSRRRRRRSAPSSPTARRSTSA
jgi:hypothetical protein